MIAVDKNELPDLWELPALEQIAKLNPKIDKSEIEDSLTVSFVPMPAVEAENGRIDVSSIKVFSEVKKGYTPFKEKDVLFAKITPCMENGKMAIVPRLNNDLGFGSTEFHVFRAYPGIEPAYIYYYIASKLFRIEAEHNMTGAVGQRRVPATWLNQQEIPLPPLNEQHRIVAKIEELFSELDKGVESLKTARQQLKVYRQALLKHAFEGKLTEQWRAENAEQLESADELLARIQQQRQTRYQQQLEAWQVEVKRWEAGGKEGKKPRKPKPIKLIKPPCKSKVSEQIPKTWMWTKIGCVSRVGTGVTPLKGKSEYYENGTIAWITSGALNKGHVIEASGYVTKLALAETNLRVYPKNTLLLAMYGEGKTRGKCSELLISAATNQAIAAIVQEGLEENTRAYLKWFLCKNYTDIRRKSSGGVQPNLNLGIVENTIFPLAPLGEMKVLVSELEKQMSVIGEIQSSIDEQLLKSEALRQSILKKAFSGQLVEQDPNDEPASKLLQRIQAQKAELAAQAKTAKAASKKKTVGRKKMAAR